MIRDVVAVFVAGLLGTALRLGIDALLPHSGNEFPLSTLLINVAGAFALGALVARLWPSAAPWLKAALGPGLLGSFTTFSAVAVALVSLTAAGDAFMAIGYLALTLLLGVGAAALGLGLGRRIIPTPEYEE